MIPGYDREKLRAAQQASLEILLEVDRICRKYGIPYMLDSGTLLGAVRHRGFIPWDDDVDVAMTGEAFERFCEHEEELGEKFALVKPDGFAGGTRFYDFVPKMVYLDSRRRTSSEEQEFFEGKLNHLWVDFFLLEPIPDGRAADRRVRFLQKMYFGLGMRYRYALDWKKYGLSDWLRVRVLVFLGHFISLPRIFEKQKKLSRKYRGTETKHLYYSNYQPDYMRCTVDTGWSSAVTELEFEGHVLMAPKEYDAVLREIYGDYMQLPPEEKRIPSHSEDIEVFK